MTDVNDIVLVPVDRITVLNPRSRNRKVFQELVTSIARLGLKKPITVRRRPGENDRYDLVCGQGRLEAFKQLEQKDIPAIVVEVDETDCLVMSLVENMARRTPTPLEHVRAVGELKTRGYTIPEIARKTDLGEQWVREICMLLGKGEERLVAAVEAGKMPVSIAIEIARTDEAAVRAALTEAYDRNQLTGSQINTIRQIIATREEWGKAYARRPGIKRKSSALSADTLLKAFRKEADRQRLLVKKAELAQTRLMFIVTALKAMLGDEHFRTLLRAENLQTMPLYLAQRLGLDDEARR